jgi:myosin heavy subunit
MLLQELMFSLLSATLWLGNVQYRTKTADSVEVVPSVALSTAAALLRVPEERLVFALSKRKITAGANVQYHTLHHMGAVCLRGRSTTRHA